MRSIGKFRVNLYRRTPHPCILVLLTQVVPGLVFPPPFREQKIVTVTIPSTVLEETIVCSGGLVRFFGLRSVNHTKIPWLEIRAKLRDARRGIVTKHPGINGRFNSLLCNSQYRVEIRRVVAVADVVFTLNR